MVCLSRSLQDSWTKVSPGQPFFGLAMIMRYPDNPSSKGSRVLPSTVTITNTIHSFFRLFPLEDATLLPSFPRACKVRLVSDHEVRTYLSHFYFVLNPEALEFIPARRASRKGFFRCTLSPPPQIAPTQRNSAITRPCRQTEVRSGCDVRM